MSLSVSVARQHAPSLGIALLVGGSMLLASSPSSLGQEKSAPLRIALVKQPFVPKRVGPGEWRFTSSNLLDVLSAFNVMK